MTHAATWLGEVQQIAGGIQPQAIDDLVDVLLITRERGGRVFVLGLGGSAANASHCVNDLRVRGGFEAYSPSDNVAEFSARINDEADGWVHVFARWLAGCRLRADDAVLVLSGSGESGPLVAAAKYAYDVKASVLGILGTARSTVEKYCRRVVVVPCPEARHRAGHAEAFQAVVWHAVVSHPRLA